METLKCTLTQPMSMKKLFQMEGMGYIDVKGRSKEGSEGIYTAVIWKVNSILQDPSMLLSMKYYATNNK